MTVYSVEITQSTLRKLEYASTATITTQLFKRGYRQQFLVGISPLCMSAKSFAGEAFTLRFIPSREDMDWNLNDLKSRGDNNIQYEAVEAIEKGQVLVIDSRNDPRSSSAGNLLMTRMMLKGVAAAVTDGAFRDGTVISKLDFFAYCSATASSTRPAFHRAVDMQLPIGCAGVAVYPGDIIVGDGDGVVVIPRAIASEVAEDACEQELKEEFVQTKIEAGASLWGTYPPNDETLKEFEVWRLRHDRKLREY